MTHMNNKQVHGLIRLVSILLVAVVLILLPGQAQASSVLLREGSRGPAVTRLQQELKTRGFFMHWRTTDFFGPMTRNAVVAFQRSRGLTADGIVGPKTNSALYGASAPAASSVSASRSNLSQSQRNDLYWLARIIHAESQGEPYQGQVAVGNVVLNRVRSGNFPNSVYGVIFEYFGSIPQFSPVADGSIYNNPSAQSTKAADEAYWGAKPVGNALYFFNPKKAAGSWIVNNRKYMTTIGNHAFYQ